MKSMKEYINVMEIGVCIRGQFQVTVTKRGRKMKCQSNNTLAYDRIRRKDYVNPKQTLYGYTEKQAYESLYRECIKKNLQ